MKTKKYQKVKDSLTIIGIASFFLYMFRIWILLIPALVAIVVLAIVMVIMRRNMVPEEKTVAVPEVSAVPDEASVLDLAYSVILKRVTELVTEFAADAKWVWKQPNAKQRIGKGEEVSVILNKAGGYKEAKVNIDNLCVVGLEFVEKQTPAKTEVVSAATEEEPKPVTENYELAAFEWVEKHILELNNRCNEAIGLGHKELVITEAELPVKDSWLDVVNELKKQGLTKLELVPQGIKIIL